MTSLEESGFPSEFLGRSGNRPNSPTACRCNGQGDILIALLARTLTNTTYMLRPDWLRRPHLKYGGVYNLKCLGRRQRGELVLYDHGTARFIGTRGDEGLRSNTAETGHDVEWEARDGAQARVRELEELLLRQNP